MKHYTTTYDRNQEVITAAMVGMRAMIDADGSIWYANASGSGASKWSPVALREINLKLNDFREVDANGDVGAITANGGILASDTTPILRGDTAESQEIFWAAGNADPIQVSLSLPSSLDGAQDVLLDLDVYSGSTDAATPTVETSWDGGTQVVDSASDTATKSATVHRITATIAAADIPDSPARLTIALTPPTHATNGIGLVRAALRYSPKTP